MKKAVLLLCFILAFINILKAQDEISDVKDKYLKGIQAIADKNFSVALKCFQDIISIQDSKISFYKSKSFYFIGEIYFIRQDFEEAAKYYRIVAQKYYNENFYHRALYKLGISTILNKKFDEGIALLNDYLSKDSEPDSMPDHALYWIGRGYFGKGDLEQALYTFQVALNKYPDSSLSFEIKNTMDTIEKMKESQAMKKDNSKNSEKNQLLLKGDRLTQEKELLNKMEQLLLIKQKLLEIKSQKVEILSRIKEQNEK